MKKSITVLTFTTSRFPFSTSFPPPSSTSSISSLTAFILSFLVLTLQPTVLALDIGPSAPTTPCVPSRTVDPSIQSDIALGCQVLVDTTGAVCTDCQVLVDTTEAVCTDYLAQQLPLAISQFCGNQTEAYAYCTSLPSTSSILDCLAFDPAGGTSTTDGEVFPSCADEALDTYNLCGNSSSDGSDGGGSGGYFATGDLVSLTQCLFLELDLCTPEDGEGHYNAVFEGGLTDCPIPAYTPACGVFSTGAAATTTAGAPSGAAASSSVAAAASTSSFAAAASSSSAAPSFQTTEPGAATSTTVTTSSISAAPTASPSSPPPGASPYFYLTLNGTFTRFISPDGSVTSDPFLAQIFYVLNGQLFTLDGLLVQAPSNGQGADDDGSPSQPLPYILFVGSEGSLPFSTAFSLFTAGIGPSMSSAQDRKRQIVGQTSLLWTNAAFAAPGTTAEFCVFGGQVYAVLLSGGLDEDFNTDCVPVALDIIYIETPLSVPSSSASSSTVTGTAFDSAAMTSAMLTGGLPKSCPVGQMLMAYTTIYL